MSKIKFICEDGGTKIQHELDSDYLYEIVEHFEDFLRGCGFVFNRLDINNRDDFNREDDLKVDFGIDDLQWYNDNGYYDSMADDTTDNNVMSWTTDQIINSSSVDDKTEVCPICKISKGVMSEWTCYDLNCPKISRR
jgi:hypothetical protein